MNRGSRYSSGWRTQRQERKCRKTSKYHAKKTAVDGLIFDSAHEARRWEELRLLEQAGKISDLRRQVRYILIPSQYDKSDAKRPKLLERAVTYTADFVYQDHGQTVVEDAKGVRTKDYIIKRKLMLRVHGIRVREV